jgi:hypothetical protein
MTKEKIVITRSGFIDAVMLTSVWYFCFAAPAHAYFDLNMGAYMMQLIFGFGAAFLFSMKSKFKKKKPKAGIPAIASQAATPVISEAKPEQTDTTV